VTTLDVLAETLAERGRQDTKFGEQNPPDGTGLSEQDTYWADLARERCQEAFRNGKGTWRDILLEEVAEAFAELDIVKLRVELVQVAAVAVAWVEAIDRRPA
jgi:hypothetical protein